MKNITLSLFVATLFIFSACQSDIKPITKIQYEQEEKQIQETEMPEQLEQIPTQSTEPLSTQEPSPTKMSVEITEPTEAPTTLVTDEPTLKPTEKPAPGPTTKPTSKPTSEPTPEPTVEPTPKPTTESEIETTPVSSSYINAAMAEINRLREANGVPSAVYSSSISSSCQSHAAEMAESGSPFHASGGYSFEAVGRASRYMSGTTMGGTAANHVVQMQSEEVTQIGIGAVYYGDYVFYVVRGN